MMKNITFGIIGCGDVTEKKSGPAFQKLPHTTLKWVMRRNEEKLNDYAKRHQVDHYTTNYMELLEDDEVDAIYIATPPYMHKFYTIEAAKHKKDVYVEKPMALSVEECREMMEVCKSEGVKLFVAYYRRGQKKFRTIKELMDKNEIGEIRSFTYHYVNPIPQFHADRPWLNDPRISGGGQLYDVGSHMMDLILYLFGDVSFVKGISSNQGKVLEVADNTSGILTFKNGVQGAVQMTFNGQVREDQLTIVGSEGTLKFGIMNNEPLEVLKSNGVDTISFEQLDHVQMPMINEVALAMAGEGDLDATGLYGLRTQEVIEALRDSKEISY